MNEGQFKIDFIGIGAQKAATTWIYNCLIEHPEICGAREKEGGVTKELHYFHKKRSLPFEKNKEELDPSSIETKGLEEYKKYFSHCSPDKLKGEFTPCYLYYPEAPKLIKQYFPQIKIIVCLRNPIERAYSQYIHEVQQDKYIYERDLDKNLKDISFKQAIKEEPEFLERGLYYKQLRRYYRLFPEVNILPLIYEDIQKDSLKFIQRIYDFLEVDDKFVPKQVDIKINTRKDKMSFLSRIIHMRIRPLLKKWKIGKKISLPPAVRKRIFFLLENKNRSSSKNEIPSKLRTELKEFYKKDIEKLEDLIKRDLSHWKEHE